MFLVVRYSSNVIQDTDQTLASAGVILALALIGVVSYSVTTFVLWHVAQRPVGPEAYILKVYADRRR